ncbi:MAG TPA: FAD-binding and (Fe-S)-binding domain-containing protein [Naasia sp.]
MTVRDRSIDRFALAHDASHYLLVPDVVLAPKSADDVARVLRAASAARRAVTFRSGGTSLSGQGVTGDVLVDGRAAFQRISVEDDGHRVRVEPGVTVRQTNARLMRHGRKLGPDPASEIACTIGGVIANNSSGMACGIAQNAYRTLESMTLVLASGTVIDTSAPDADTRLRDLEPDVHSGLARLRDSLRADSVAVAEIRRQYAMKNTMGYGLNAFLDFDLPVDILTHLVVGSEGTLAFVAEAVFRTVELLPYAATGLAVFASLHDAMEALPQLVATGLATIELMDARSLRVAQQQSDCPPSVADLDVAGHAALLLEFQTRTSDDLAATQRSASEVFAALRTTRPVTLSTDPTQRSALWHTRKGLYTTIAGARPSGTTALLEDIAVPVGQMLSTCEALLRMFDRHGYEDSVIFGHAKDGNIHFMLTERFDDPSSLARYERFTAELVEIVLAHGGTLKAEHGTGRTMAPFVRRQFGDILYEVMLAVKSMCDPAGILNPGVVLSDDPTSYLRNLKVVPTVETEVDRCVECGYCEPTCPSRTLTLTPRQRIVLRRDIAAARGRGDEELASELLDDYEYDGVQTCAVDGMCGTACPVDINTGDLVRRLRAGSRSTLEQNASAVLAQSWSTVTRAGASAMSIAAALPPRLPAVATKLARALLGPETVPLYDAGLPRGGRARPRSGSGGRPVEFVYFSACITTMFGADDGTHGVSAALLALCDRAGVGWSVPANLRGLCCGTPWKSKGFSLGYSRMTETVLPALLAASDGGRLPIVCDAASCTEGLETMRRLAVDAGGSFEALRFVDAVQFAHDRILPMLAVTSPFASITVHTTCSTAQLGIDSALISIARAIATDVHVPVDWGCCAFAGDRGLLHPELTAAATAAEAAEVRAAMAHEHVSANRTCEIGMSRATGFSYRHVIEALERATR